MLAEHAVSARIVAEAISGRVANLRKHVEAVRREDPEGIHDMRVASRRLRAALSELRAFLDKRQRMALLEQARRITQLLGRPREMDVTLAILETHRAACPNNDAGLDKALDRLRAERAALSAACAEAVAVTESLELDEALVALLDPERVKDRDLFDVAPKRLKRRLRELTEDYLRWRASGERAQLHRVRIAFKKFRYVCEVFLPVYEDRMKPLIAELKRVQESLGGWNDYRVVCEELEKLRDLVPSEDHTGMDAVIQTFDQQANAILEEFCKSADQFFSVENRRALRCVFKEPLAPATV